MSKEFSHDKLKERIKDVFRNDAYKDHHDVLIEMFPEIYEEMRDDLYQRVYKIGHLYVRKASNNVISLLYLTFTTAESVDGTLEVGLLNLCTGGWWSRTIRIPYDRKKLSPKEWSQITLKTDPNKFIHIGFIGHNQHTVYRVGKFDTYSPIWTEGEEEQ